MVGNRDRHRQIRHRCNEHSGSINGTAIAFAKYVAVDVVAIAIVVVVLVAVVAVAAKFVIVALLEVA